MSRAEWQVPSVGPQPESRRLLDHEEALTRQQPPGSRRKFSRNLSEWLFFSSSTQLVFFVSVCLNLIHSSVSLITPSVSCVIPESSLGKELQHSWLQFSPLTHLFIHSFIPVCPYSTLDKLPVDCRTSVNINLLMICYLFLFFLIQALFGILNLQSCSLVSEQSDSQLVASRFPPNPLDLMSFAFTLTTVYIAVSHWRHKTTFEHKWNFWRKQKSNKFHTL